jgi:hypothetical protein
LATRSFEKIISRYLGTDFFQIRIGIWRECEPCHFCSALLRYLASKSGQNVLKNVAIPRIPGPCLAASHALAVAGHALAAGFGHSEGLATLKNMVEARLRR